MKSLWRLSCRSQSICVNFASESSVINWFQGLLLFHMNQCTDHWTHQSLTWRSKWKLYWDEPHPPRPPCHKRLQRSRRRGRARGCEFLVSARYRELEERHWVTDLLVEITDGVPPVFLFPFLLRLLKGSSKWPWFFAVKKEFRSEKICRQFMQSTCSFQPDGNCCIRVMLSSERAL